MGIPKFLFSNLQKFTSLSKSVTELYHPNQNHIFPILSFTDNPNLFEKDEYTESIKTKIKLLTGGKGVYPYSLCNNAYVIKVVTFPPMNEFITI